MLGKVLLDELYALLEEPTGLTRWLSTCLEQVGLKGMALVDWPAGRSHEPRVRAAGFAERTPESLAAGLEQSLEAGAQIMAPGDDWLELDGSNAAGAVRFLATPVLPDSRDLPGIWLLVDAGPGAGSGSDWAADLNEIFPHLQRMLRLARQQAERESQAALVLEMLDFSPWGIVTLCAREGIVYANAEAARILDQSDGLTVRNGRLRLPDRDAGSRLNEFVECAQQVRVDSDELLEMVVSRPSGAPGYRLLGRPMSSPAQSPAGELAITRVVVLIHDPSERQMPETSQLMQFFGLSRAEARVARSLYQGYSVQDTAQRLGLSSNTVRSHLKKIYRKVGVESQGGLQRELASSPRMSLIRSA